MLIDAPLEPFLWLRYIDDILVIWTHGEEQLQNFHEFINQYHPTIKFTMEFSHEQIVFLDTLVKKSADKDKLLVELYTKPTDTHNYLHFKSAHPGHTKRGGPYGQFLRIRRNCTLDTDYQKHSLFLKEKYLQRGYPENLLEYSRERAQKQNRAELLKPKLPPQDSQGQTQTQTPAPNVVPLILTHHPSNHQVRKIIMDNWGILKYSDLCTKALPEEPLFATRKNTNLKDLLIRSRMTPVTQTPGTVPNPWPNCKIRNCDVCPPIKLNNKAISTVTSKQYTIPTYTQCSTTNVIYLLTCSVCKLQYVGETKNSFRRRFLDHKGYIRRNENQPTATHIKSHRDPNAHYIPQILEVIKKDPSLPDTTSFRKKREVFWIYKLRTLLPRGLNKLI